MRSHERVTLHSLEPGAGNGTPVVLLHGYTETSRVWRPLTDTLGEGRVVIAPDLPGVGDSGMLDKGYDKATVARDIHALVRKLGFCKVNLVGHDLGLMVACAYAAQYPHEVDGVVFMDALLPGIGDVVVGVAAARQVAFPFPRRHAA